MNTTAPKQDMPAVSVIIPYFQRDAGVLTRSIQSVVDQDYPGEIHIVVVDDGSPLPARQELASFRAENAAGRRQLEILCQPNGGPAIARNTALDRIAGKVEYGAFLDSDDCWHPAHIRRAITQLQRGKDFYFSDHLPINRQRSAFQRDRFTPGEHGAALGDNCFSFDRDFFDQTIRNNIVCMPTVVFRVAIIEQLRFNPEFQFAGEDHLFWLGISQKTRRIVISAEQEVDLGRGVNIYESAKTLAAPRTFRRIANEIRFRKALPKLFSLTPHQLSRTAEIIGHLRGEFAINAIHALKTTPLTGLRETAAFLHKDHQSVFAIWSEIVKACKRRALA